MYIYFVLEYSCC